MAPGVRTVVLAALGLLAASALKEVASSCASSGDPHFICPDGYPFQFHGKSAAAYSLMSTEDIQVNMLVEQGLREHNNETFIMAVSMMTASGHQVMIKVEKPTTSNRTTDLWADGQPHGVLASVHVQVDGVSLLNTPTKGDFMNQLTADGKAALIANGAIVTGWGSPAEGQGERSARVETIELADGALKVSFVKYSPAHGYPHNVTITVEDDMFSFGVARMEHRSAESKIASHAGMDYLELTAVQTVKKENGVAAAARKLLAALPQLGGVFGTYCGPADARPAEGAPENEHEYRVGEGAAGLHKTKCARCVPLEMAPGAAGVLATTKKNKVAVVASQVVQAVPSTVTEQSEAEAPHLHGRALLSLCETPTPTCTETKCATKGCLDGDYNTSKFVYGSYIDYCDISDEHCDGRPDCDECYYGYNEDDATCCMEDYTECINDPCGDKNTCHPDCTPTETKCDTSDCLDGSNSTVGPHTGNVDDYCDPDDTYCDGRPDCDECHYGYTGFNDDSGSYWCCESGESDCSGPNAVK